MLVNVIDAEPVLLFVEVGVPGGDWLGVTLPLGVPETLPVVDATAVPVAEAVAVGVEDRVDVGVPDEEGRARGEAAGEGVFVSDVYTGALHSARYVKPVPADANRAGVVPTVAPPPVSVLVSYL